MTKRRKLSILALTLLSLPVFAAAPKRLSVIIGGAPLEGKALWYDNQVYVPLESVSKALEGQYHYDAVQGVASVHLGSKHAVKNSRTASRPPYQTPPRCR